MHPEAPTYRALRIRAEFVQPPQCLSGMLGRDDQTIASGCTDRFGRGCSFQLADWRPRGSGERGRRVVDAAASDRSRDIGAKWRFLAAACLVTLCFRLTMFRWRIYSAAIGTRALRKFCPDAMASEQFAPAPMPVPFPCFFISSIDAPRGAVGWRRRRSPCIFARGERVYHGKQNDHRRFPPGGNQGGGPTRKSRRGI